MICFQELEGISVNDEEKEKTLEKWERLGNEFFNYERSVKHIIDEYASKRALEHQIKKAQKELIQSGMGECEVKTIYDDFYKNRKGLSL